MSKLDATTRKRIDRVQNGGVERMLASELMAHRLTKPVVEHATVALVHHVATEGLSSPEAAKRALLHGVRLGQEEVRREFEKAILAARDFARDFAVSQVNLELAEAFKAMAETLPGMEVKARLVARRAVGMLEQDATSSALAGYSMTQKWGASAFSEYNRWKAKGGGPADLPRRLQGIADIVDPARKRHAVTQAVDVFNDEKRAVWLELKVPGGARAKSKAEVPAPVPFPPPRKGDMLPSGPERGLPYGWGAGMFDIWSAVLDRKTCPACGTVDGSMVPTGKDFPGFRRPPLHGHCRCFVASVFVPSGLANFLPGIQIDYGAQKEDIAEYMKGRTLNLGEGVRHAQRFVDEALAKKGHSPQVLTERLQNRAYFPRVPARPRAPRLPALP